MRRHCVWLAMIVWLAPVPLSAATGPAADVCPRAAPGSGTGASHGDVLHLLQRLPQKVARLHNMAEAASHHWELQASHDRRAGRTLNYAGAAAIGIPVCVLCLCLGICYGRTSSSSRRPSDPIPAEADPTPAAAGEDADTSEEPQLTGVEGLKQRQAQLVKQQVMNNKELESVRSAIQKAEEVEHPHVESEAISHEEAEKQAEEHIKITEMMLQRNVLSAFAYAAPFAMQGKKLLESVRKRTKAARERASKGAYEEVKGLVQDISEAFEVEDIIHSQFGLLSEVEIPSLSIVIASAFAPAQIRMIHAGYWIAVMLRLVFLSFDILTLALNWYSSCKTPAGTSLESDSYELIYWFAIDAGVSTLVLLIRCMVVRRLSTVLAEIDEPPPFDVGQDVIQTLRSHVDYYLTTGGKALIALDAVLTSHFVHLANWSIIFDCLWCCWGLHVAFNSPWVACGSTALVVLRVRVVLFLLLIVPYLLQVVLFIASRILSSKSTYAAILSAAASADRKVGIGFPLVTLLARSFLVRDATDLLTLELRMHEMERDRIESLREAAAKEAETNEREKDKVEKAIERLKEKRKSEAAKSSTDVFWEQHDHVREKVLNSAEVVFRQANEKAKTAAEKAKEQVDGWEHGEGPEFLQALARGEAYEKAQEYIHAAEEKGMAMAKKIKEDKRVQEALAKVEHLAEEAFEEGVAAVDKLAHDERLKEAMAKAEGMAEQAYEQGAAAVDKVAHDERVQAAMARAEGMAEQAYEQGAATVDKVAHDERVQEAMAKAKGMAKSSQEKTVI